MRIISSKLSDLEKERDEWDAQAAVKKQMQDDARRQYRAAESKITDAVKSDVENMLSGFKLLEFDVSVSRGWSTRGEGLVVRVQCNEHKKFDDSSALSWEWTAKLENDQVVKESGSWSGLKAVTLEQVESLSQTVEAIKILNKIDWDTVLNKELPKYEDYYTEEMIQGRRPDFESQIREATLDEIAGTNTLVKGTSSGRYYREGVPVWYKIIKKSGSQYTVTETLVSMPKQNDLSDDYSYRITKDRLLALIDRNIQTADVSEIM